MATAHQPQRNFLSFLFDSLIGSDKFRRASQTFQTIMKPVGSYSGRESPTISRDKPMITNPWGSYATFGVLGERHGTLAPGQSYNYLTGQLSDPKLHANTAQRLNEATNQRQINEVGLSAASQGSARQAPSVLATLDQLYLANQATSVTSSQQLSAFAQINQGGTILGRQAPTPTNPAPVARAQLKSSGR